MLEEIARAAGLDSIDAFDTRWAYEYADDEALGRGMLAPAGIGELVGPSRQTEVLEAIRAGLAPYRGGDGRYRLENEYHYVVARA